MEGDEGWEKKGLHQTTYWQVSRDCFAGIRSAAQEWEYGRGSPHHPEEAPFCETKASSHSCWGCSETLLFFESRIHRLESSLSVPSDLRHTGNAFLRIDISIFVSKSVRFTYPLKIKTANLILERMQQRLSQYRELELFLLWAYLCSSAGSQGQLPFCKPMDKFELAIY